MAEETKPAQTSPAVKQKPRQEEARKNSKKSQGVQSAPVSTPKDGSCSDERCPRHGGLKTRGRIFEGKVVSARTKKTAVVELQYLRSVPKYERFEKRRSKMHVHIPDCYKVREGDMIKFMECRKISKTKAFVIIE
ncbi:MAG TPA: 30S ribosomal protein S17 [Candidatus Norongarragalinales archaeon]|nr:30S ribosomal protein S17 [Candidatus Norongarragalinales archaeon]